MMSKSAAYLLLVILVALFFSGCHVKTFPLQKRYVDENKKCVWQPATKCPPYVTYYNVTQKDTLELHVKNNLVYNVNDQLFDTTGADPTGITGTKAAIYVASKDGHLYASNQNKVYLFHHSTIMAGKPVVAAGEMQAKKGIITTISNCSGHYKPDKDLTKAMITKILKDKKYTRSFKYNSCSSPELEKYLGE